MSAIADYLQVCFSGAMLPATAVLLLVMMYWSLVIIAGLDLDLFDFDLDLDGEPDLQATSGLGMTVLRFLNIGAVPLMMWASVFAIVFWGLSMFLDRLFDNPEQRTQWFYALQYGIRNFALAALLTKLFTQPLRGRFEGKEALAAADMIGRTCRITTSKVTEKFGQAEYQSEGAPLLIHVRTRVPTPLTKGDVAVIVDYDTESNVYFVEQPTGEEAE